MSKYKLYPSINDRSNWVKPSEIQTRNVMNFISLCDGKNSIEDISNKININTKTAKKIFQKLIKLKLIKLQ